MFQGQTQREEGHAEPVPTETNLPVPQLMSLNFGLWAEKQVVNVTYYEFLYESRSAPTDGIGTSSHQVKFKEKKKNKSWRKINK